MLAIDKLVKTLKIALRLRFVNLGFINLRFVKRIVGICAPLMEFMGCAQCPVLPAQKPHGKENYCSDFHKLSSKKLRKTFGEENFMRFSGFLGLWLDIFCSTLTTKQTVIHEENHIGLD